MDMIDKKLEELNKLLENSSNESKEEIKKVMKEVVPTYKEMEQ